MGSYQGESLPIWPSEARGKKKVMLGIKSGILGLPNGD
jgi:hypothetical protein